MTMTREQVEALLAEGAANHCGNDLARALLDELDAVKAELGTTGPDGEWFCEDHLNMPQGHDGCRGAGVPSSVHARLNLACNLLRHAKDAAVQARQQAELFGVSPNAVATLRARAEAAEAANAALTARNEALVGALETVRLRLLADDHRSLADVFDAIDAALKETPNA